MSILRYRILTVIALFSLHASVEAQYYKVKASHDPFSLRKAPGISNFFGRDQTTILLGPNGTPLLTGHYAENVFDYWGLFADGTERDAIISRTDHRWTSDFVPLKPEHVAFLRPIFIDRSHSLQLPPIIGLILIPVPAPYSHIPSIWDIGADLYRPREIRDAAVAIANELHLGSHIEKIVEFSPDGDTFQIGIYLKVIGSNGESNWWPLTRDYYVRDN
jgi:hypothetical protein